MASQPAPQRFGIARPITYRDKGHRHGFITRLFSPGDLGHLLKPFVFLDLFESSHVSGKGFAPHPHSGIATVSVFLDGAMTYADSTGSAGALSPGSVEWMRAGAGVWHSGEMPEGSAARGYQLWLALPPELELAPPESQYLEADAIPSVGPARVILGNYQGVDSPIALPFPVTYLHVRLGDGERWTFSPDTGQMVAFVACNAGRLRVSGMIIAREVAAFELGNSPIDFIADGAAEFVIGAAAPHPYPLVTGHYSVHTNVAALAEGERNIARLELSDVVQALRLR